MFLESITSHPPVAVEPIAGRADAPPSAFSCSCVDAGLDAAWVQAAGELDIATAPQLERTLRETQMQSRLVVLDLRELAFIDSSGMHAIVNASSRARQGGRRLILLRGRATVDRVFTLTGAFDEVEIGDIAPVTPVTDAPQRSLVASSLLMTG